MPQDEVEMEHFERIVTDVRARLDPAVFTTAWAEGQAMAPEQAVACVLARG